MLDKGAIGARLGDFDLDTIVTGDARELSRGENYLFPYSTARWQGWQ